MLPFFSIDAAMTALVVKTAKVMSEIPFMAEYSAIFDEYFGPRDGGKELPRQNWKIIQA